MRLFVIFLILNVQFSHIFAFPPNPSESSSQADHHLKGYECGNVFFTYKLVKETLSLALSSMDKDYHYPQRYRGKLYGESSFEEYFLYPIKKIGSHTMPQTIHTNTIFYVVLTRNNNNEVDVIAKITTGEYTKCTRTYSTQKGPSNSVSEITNGFLCGHKFFSYEIIHESLTLAQAKVKENTIYPSPYIGNLYPAQSGHLIWPIMKKNMLYKSGSAHIGPYFLIINNQRKFVDVVVRGFGKNFLRCIRSRKPQKTSASELHGMVSVPSLKSGYVCGRVFFDDAVLEGNAVIVKEQADKEIRNKFLEEYSGPPFNQQCLTWPLMTDGNLAMKGHKGPYRLILTPSYNVMSVAMILKGKLTVCDRRTMMIEKNHDTSDYHCNKQYFSHRQLLAAAESACEKIKAVTKNFYPARYEGPGFELGGPYFTYPVFGNDNKIFKIRPGLHRVVINANCEVVGALTTLNIIYSGELNNRGRKKLVKCHRLADGPIPHGFFGANAEAVFEHRVRY